MGSFLADCEALFETKDLYAVLGLDTPKAQRAKLAAAQVKKAYYKASLRWHPDRNASEEATRRFQLISKAYTVLADKDARKLYDDTGIVASEDENLGQGLQEWEAVWRSLFKPITEDDIEAFKREYKDSEEERRDIAKAYTESGGHIQDILDGIYMANVVDDEERVSGIVRELMAAGEVEELAAFSKESRASKAKRRRAAEAEAREAEELLADIRRKEAPAAAASGDDSLQALILARQAKRGSAAEYAGGARLPRGEVRPKAQGQEGLHRRLLLLLPRAQGQGQEEGQVTCAFSNFAAFPIPLRLMRAFGLAW